VAKKIEDPLTAELESIKKLMVLLLLKLGVSQGEVAKALGVSQPSISRMIPGKVRPLKE
jgi:predicted transcriptional regulator